MDKIVRRSDSSYSYKGNVYVTAFRSGNGAEIATGLLNDRCYIIIGTNSVKDLKKELDEMEDQYSSLHTLRALYKIMNLQKLLESKCDCIQEKL